jgi:Flp pilus assembly protein TadD
MFQALKSAANDYRWSRSRVLPLPEAVAGFPAHSSHEESSPVLVPLFPLASRKPRILLACVAAFAFLIGAGSAGAAFYFLNKTAPAKTAPEKVAVAPASILAAPSAPTQIARHAKKVENEPPGIALPAESLIPNAETEDIAKQLQTLPALSGEEAGKSSPSHVVMSATESISSDGLLQEAQTQLEAKNYAGANARYDAVLAHDSDNPAAWAGKVYALQQSGTPEALDELRQIVLVRPHLAPAQAALARLSMQRGEKEAALAAAQRAVELEPSNGLYRLSLAVLFDRLERKTEALAQYRQLQPPVSPAIQQRIAYLSVLDQPKDKP